MHNDSDVHIQPAPLDPAVWRLDVPLAVLERADGPHLLSVWIAVRWLQAAVPTRRGFSTREIAKRAHVDRKYVSQWVSRLVVLDLLEIVGEELIPNLHPRPIYAIPLAALEAASLEMAPRVVAAYRGHRAPRSSLPSGPVTESVTVRVVLPSLHGTQDEIEHVVLDAVPNGDAPGDSEDQTGGVKEQASGNMQGQTGGNEDQEPGGIQGQTSGDKRDRIKEGKNERGRETAHTWEGLATGEPERATATPPSSPALPAAPLTLWRSVRHTSQPMDDLRISALIADHNDPTEGFGAYWVGRAILAADATDSTFATNPRALNLVRAILARWRRELAYGSDTPAFVQGKHRSARQATTVADTTPTPRPSPPDGARWRTAGTAPVADSDSDGVPTEPTKAPATTSRWRIATAGGVA